MQKDCRNAGGVGSRMHEEKTWNVHTGSLKNLITTLPAYNSIQSDYMLSRQFPYKLAIILN